MAHVNAPLVAETSITTGTGSYSLAGALTDRRTFVVGIGNGNTCNYTAKMGAVFEEGIGLVTDGTPDTLARVRVVKSSNGDAPVDWGAGTKTIHCDFPSWKGGPAREVLTADRTYYVRTDGSNDNTGLVDSAGGAFLTWQYAYDLICATLDFGGFAVIIKHGEETGVKTFSSSSAELLLIDSAWVGGGQLYIEGSAGDLSTPSDLVFSTTGYSCIRINCRLPGVVVIQGMKFTTTTSGSGIWVNDVSAVTIWDVEFGACAEYHVQASNAGAFVYYGGSCIISGGANISLNFAFGAQLWMDGDVTLTGTPAFTWAFIAADIGAIVGVYSPTASFTGSATGPRFLATNNGIINTYGGALDFFPGNSDGVVSDGGIYQGSTILAAKDSLYRSAITGADTVVAGDKGNLIEITSGTFTLSFDDAATLGDGFWCDILNSGTGVVTLDPDGSELIDGLSSWKLYPGGKIRVYCDGSTLESTLLAPMRAEFNASDTFTKPGCGTFADVYCWGGGGSGAKGAASAPGGGGGGGGCTPRLGLLLSAIGATETVTIGAGGAAQTSASTVGNNGGNTTFGALVTGYGGGGGGYSTTGGPGGGGGGVLSAGTNGGTNAGTLIAGGGPDNRTLNDAQDSLVNFRMINSHFGGGVGGHPHSTANLWPGGDSVYGGGGGGGGRDTSGSATANRGGNSLYGGGGGGGAANSGSPGNAGTSVYGGNGSAGAIDSNTSSAGTQPGGGSGGTEGGNSGPGGDGRCVVIIY